MNQNIIKKNIKNLQLLIFVMVLIVIIICISIFYFFSKPETIDFQNTDIRGSIKIVEDLIIIPTNLGYYKNKIDDKDIDNFIKTDYPIDYIVSFNNNKLIYVTVSEEEGKIYLIKDKNKFELQDYVSKSVPRDQDKYIGAIKSTDDGKYLAISSDTGIKIWDVDEVKIVFEKELEKTNLLNFSNDNKYIVLKNYVWIEVYDFIENEQIADIDYSSDRALFIQSLAVNNDKIFVASNLKNIYSFDFKGNKLKSLATDDYVQNITINKNKLLIITENSVEEVDFDLTNSNNLCNQYINNFTAFIPFDHYWILINDDNVHIYEEEMKKEINTIDLKSI